MLKCASKWLKSARLAKRFTITEDTLNKMNVQPLRNTLGTLPIQKSNSKERSNPAKSKKFHFVSQKKENFNPEAGKQSRLALLRSDYSRLVLGADAFLHRPNYGSIDRSGGFVSIMDHVITFKSVAHRKATGRGNQATRTISKYWPELAERESKLTVNEIMAKTLKLLPQLKTENDRRLAVKSMIDLVNWKEHSNQIIATVDFVDQLEIELDSYVREDLDEVAVEGDKERDCLGCVK